MKSKIIEILLQQMPLGNFKGQRVTTDDLNRTADEILALHNKEMEKFANQLGISTTPADYFLEDSHERRAQERQSTFRKIERDVRKKYASEKCKSGLKKCYCQKCVGENNMSFEEDEPECEHDGYSICRLCGDSNINWGSMQRTGDEVV